MARLPTEPSLGRDVPQEQTGQILEWDPGSYLDLFLSQSQLSNSASLEPGLVSLLSMNTDLTGQQCVDLARLAQIRFPFLDLWLARALREAAVDQMQRILWVLSEISTSNRVLPLLAPALRTTDERVRSKAALLLSELSGNPSLANRLHRGANPRVRANAIEGLWGVKHPGAIYTLRLMTRDTDNRTMANAALGLFLVGDEMGIAVLREMAQNQEPLNRASAAWAMGETGERLLLPLLQRLSDDPAAIVRRNARRAVVKMTKLGDRTSRA